jgi:hypothetical protein
MFKHMESEHYTAEWLMGHKGNKAGNKKIS